MTAALSELTGNVWAFVRSDPALVRQLNTPGNWSTWQATGQTAPRRELASEPSHVRHGAQVVPAPEMARRVARSGT